MSADILAFTVPTFPKGGAEYPSVNRLIGKMKGKKSPEYYALKTAVREAAWEEMRRTGWVTATYYVDVHWKRYIPTRRGFDPMNTMKCEQDAMQPDNETGFPGVYVNDSLVRPHPDLPQYDPEPGAIDRIAIAVMRCYPSLVDFQMRLTVGNGLRPVKAVVPRATVAPAVALADGRRPTMNGVPITPAQLKALPPDMREIVERTMRP